MNWIKIETSTPEKPEVMAVARILKVHPYHALGLVVRFWIWCDMNVSDGYIRHTTTLDIDMMVKQEGFAQAMIDVGWIITDSEGVYVPNHDRHMDKSAKNRSLKSERQKRWREAQNRKGKV